MDFRAHPKFDVFASALEADRGLPGGLLKSLVTAESSGRADARSPAGAQGLTQFMPATAKQYNVDVSNPWDSLRGAADYLSDLHKKHGSVEAAVSAYNGGYHNAQFFKDGTVPSTTKVSSANHAENKRYVAQVTKGLSQGVTAGEVSDLVAQLANAGEAPVAIVEKLAQNPALATIVRGAEQKGYSPEDIVTRMGGEAYASVKAKRDAVSADGALGRAAAGAGYAVDDLAAGTRQLGSRISGDDKALARQQAEQVRAEQDPTRRAVLDSTGGTVGNIGAKVVPSVAAALLPGGIVAQAAIQGGLGAAQGALTPTTDEGQFGTNVVVGGGAGAIGGGAGAALTKAPAFFSKAAQASARGGQSAEQQAAREAVRSQAGIQTSLAERYPVLGDVADWVSNNVPGARIGGADKRLLRDPEIARAITSRIGVEGDELTAALVKRAQANVSSMYDEALDGVSVPLPPELRSSVVANMQRSLNSAPAEVAEALIRKQQPLIDAIKQGADVPARTLQSVRSDLGAMLSEASTSPANKAALGELRTALNNALEQGLPEDNLLKFRKANETYKNLQVVENYGRRTNWQADEFNARKFMTSVKQEDKKLLERGDAPYQDLADALVLRSTAPNAGAQLIQGAAAIGTGGTSLAGGAMAGQLALRILTDPKYAAQLASMSPVQRAALQQAAAAARVGGAVAPQATQSRPSAQVIPFRRAA